jgi:hypothetical protein
VPDCAPFALSLDRSLARSLRWNGMLLVKPLSLFTLLTCKSLTRSAERVHGEQKASIMCIWLRNGKRNACGRNKKEHTRDLAFVHGRIFVSTVVTLVPPLVSGEYSSCYENNGKVCVKEKYCSHFLFYAIFRSWSPQLYA